MKKFCTECGGLISEEDRICPHCGYRIIQAGDADSPSKLSIAIIILLIIGAIFTSLFTMLIGLIWCVPMTISLCHKLRKNLPISTGWKICTIIFVSTIAGILMFCDNQPRNPKY